MKKTALIIFLVVIFVIAAYILNQKAINQSSYEGLPTVSCIVNTKPIKQSYVFNIKIKILGKDHPLDPNIGHGYARCQRAIYTNDSSGIVYVESNDSDNYTLNNFFQVWGKTFNKKQIFSYRSQSEHKIRVFINGSEVQTIEDTPLKNGETIFIVYE